MEHIKKSSSIVGNGEKITKIETPPMDSLARNETFSFTFQWPNTLWMGRNSKAEYVRKLIVVFESSNIKYMGEDKQRVLFSPNAKRWVNVVARVTKAITD
jgi:hypothetical protein